MNSYLNSDYKQCTESKLGWVHSAHTQNPGRAHTARAVPRSWALLRAQQAGRVYVARSQRRSRAQHAQVARMLGVRWSQHAQAACPRSRPQNRVATSFPLPNPRPGSDFLSGSRPPGRLSQVATPTTCCDLLSAQPN